jgi:putative endonuclease
MIRIFTSKTQQSGEKGEREAVSFLKKQGFSIIERNVPNKFGEIDIVAKKKGEYRFFEVKAGKQGSWINPAENLSKDKIRKFLVSVEHYCLMHGIKRYKAQGIIVLQSTAGAYTVETIDLF